MNYEDAISYIEQLNTRGIALGLERITALLEILGNPQDTLRVIHVAGTNGKGSVCALIDSALRQAGMRVGRYISPALYAYLERFQINGAYMSEEAFAQILARVREACDNMEEKGLELPTVFEVETAVAFLYFQAAGCDYVLLEVGMGGRLDSTNVIMRPILSVITSISMDHTGMLGNTLGEIAAEKAGIIKESCPVVLAWQKPEAMNVLLAKCRDCHTVPVIADTLYLYDTQWGLSGQRFCYKTWQNLSIRLLGEYQLMNAITALEALWVLQEHDLRLTDDTIRQGLEQASWPGRFEIIGEKPLFIVDGAHNPAGAQALADTIQRLHNSKAVNDTGSVWLLMGVFRDKAYEEIGRIMSQCGNRLITFQPPGERGLESEVLAEAMKPYYTKIEMKQTAEDAVQYVMHHASAEDIIISFGSLSTIKAVQDAVKAWEGERNGK